MVTGKNHGVPTSFIIAYMKYTLNTGPSTLKEIINTLCSFKYKTKMPKCS